MRIFIAFVYLLIVINSAYACFDTYLFMKKGSMVYPYKSTVFELNTEYSFNKFNSPVNDMFFTNGSFYYGLLRNLSVQVSIGSGEKERGEFRIDSYSMRGVYNLYTSDIGNYTLDVMFEQNGNFTKSENEVGISLPNIFHMTDFLYVLHPTASYAIEEKNFTIGAHTGLFYNFEERGIIGVGAEYASVQSSSYAGKRITQSEYSASLFFGAQIGNAIFIQNEIAKGLANSRDLGFALTAKLIM